MSFFSESLSHEVPGDRASYEVGDSLRGAVLSAVVFAVAVLAFAPSLPGPFILDDVPLIQHNAKVHSLSNFASYWTQDFWDVGLSEAQLGDRLRYFRPLPLISYALDWGIGAGHSTVFHAVNLLLHGLVSVLSFHALWRWTGRRGAAALVALIFAVHPAKAENVAWISGRPDLLLAVGLLLASLGMARSWRNQVGGLSLQVLGTAVAYLSKEHAVVLPAFAFVEAWVLAGRPQLSRGSLAMALRRAAPQCAVAVAYLVARGLVAPLRQFEVSGLEPVAHAGLVLETLGRLLELWWLPRDLSLSAAALETRPGAGPVVSTPHVVACALALCVTVWVVWRGRRRPGLVLATLGWWGLCLPVSNLVWTGMATLTSARFAYVPSLAASWLLIELSPLLVGRVGRRGAVALGGLVALGLTAWSTVRSVDFASSDRFWSVELERHPDAVTPNLVAVGRERRQGRPRRAFAAALRALAVTGAGRSQDVQRAQLLLAALELLVELTPDSERASLERASQFLDDLAAGRPARLSVPTGRLSVEPESRLRRDVLAHGARLGLVRAELRVRLGDDEGALVAARAAVTACAKCADVWQRAGLVALRAGDRTLAATWARGPAASAWSAVPVNLRVALEATEPLDQALATATGAHRVQLQARRFSSLGLGGRAWAALRPHREQILAAGGAAAESYALAACRAGARDEAREALQGAGLSEESARRQIEKWELELLRVDAPLPVPADDLTRVLSGLLDDRQNPKPS